jgi:yeast amino acid transporter
LPYDPCSYLYVLLIRSYIGIPTFFILWLGYKIAYKTKVIPLNEVDLVTGLREIDEEEEKFLAEKAVQGPQSMWRNLWDSM